MEGRREEVKVERWENPMPSYITLFRIGISKIRGTLDELYKTIWGKKEKSPEEIIPKDCWELVFQNLNVEDLRSCRAVCKSFKEIADLSRFKVKWKFNMVLPLLFPHLKSTSEGRVSWTNLSSIRMTCSSWRHPLDKYVSEVYKQPRSNFFPRCSATPLITNFKNLEDVDEFQDKFGECNTNPFPARNVCIQNCEDFPWGEADGDDWDDARFEEIEKAREIFQLRYVEKVADLLNYFGRNIFKLHLNFSHEEYYYACSPLNLCKFIKGITIHLPNLAVFRLDCMTDAREDEQEIASYTQGNKPAALSKLETLYIGTVDKTVVDYLLDAFSPQLKTLVRTDLLHCNVRMGKFKNLEKLSHPMGREDTLESFQFLKSPLKFLRVICDCYDPFYFRQLSLKMDKVLRNLKHLPIEYLDIRIRNFEGVTIPEAAIPLEEYLNESIKTLRIEITRRHLQNPLLEYNISAQFLKSLTKLETLILELVPLPTPPPAPQPNFLGSSSHLDLFECVLDEDWKKRVSHSNVWKQMPSLKTLTVWRTQLGRGGEHLKSGSAWKRP